MVFDGGIGVWTYFCVQTPVPSYMSFPACYTGYAHKLPGEPKKWRIETIGWTMLKAWRSARPSR